MTTEPAEIALDRRPALREAGLWLSAGVVVLAAHGAFAYLLRDVGSLPEHDAVEQAMVVDLAPLPISVPEAVQTETLAQEEPVEETEPLEETTETAEAEPDEVAQETPEQETPEQAEDTEQVEETQPEEETEQAVAETAEPEEEPEPEPQEVETDEPEVVERETAEVVTPEVVLPLPQPRPEPSAEKKVERKKPAPRKQETAKQETAKKQPPAERPKRQDRQPSPASQASAASRAPSIDPTRWNSAVRAAIARRASAVRGMRGTVRVSFVVSPSGAIVSASVTGSSGDARLDSAALGMVRAARVPAPPAGLGGSRHAFAIPLTFR